jgi:hypothetical protein
VPGALVLGSDAAAATAAENDSPVPRALLICAP